MPLRASQPDCKALLRAAIEQRTSVDNSLVLCSGGRSKRRRSLWSSSRASVHALLEAGYPRETDQVLEKASSRCGGSDEILVYRYKARFIASDFRAALQFADQLVQSDPAEAQFRYWRGNAYEELKDFSSALTDYLNSVQLLGEPSSISPQNFYDISRMYAALGRYCDAITPLETFVFFDPARRRTAQITKLISEYASKGRCDVLYAGGSARVSRLSLPGMTGVNTLIVTINGVSGNFLLDTGATYVAVTSNFGLKAKLNMENAIQLPIKTVGGNIVADLGYAATVNVGAAQGYSVPVAVLRGSADPFGNRLDGLLGMSFLARFQLNLSSQAIELTALPLR